LKQKFDREMLKLVHENELREALARDIEATAKVEEELNDLKRANKEHADRIEEEFRTQDNLRRELELLRSEEGEESVDNAPERAS
jgi:hypothetical protein